ncbi:CbtA family protein [Streptosporangium sp. NPDC002607]
MTMRALLLRGMLVGLVSAALALVFAWIFGEPQVSLAIAFEGHHAHEAAAAEPETVSRIVQQTSGLAVAIGLFGVAIGGLFAVAFALAYGRIGGFGVRATSVLVAGGGFVTPRPLPVQASFPSLLRGPERDVPPPVREHVRWTPPKEARAPRSSLGGAVHRPDRVRGS